MWVRVIQNKCFYSLLCSLQTDRNTLPKKGLEYVTVKSTFIHFSHCGASFFWSEHNVSLLRRYGTSLSESEGSKPGRRHSHTIVSMTESDSPPQLPSPTRPLHLSSGKAPLTNVGEFACSMVQTYSKKYFLFDLRYKWGWRSLMIRSSHLWFLVTGMLC